MSSFCRYYLSTHLPHLPGLVFYACLSLFINETHPALCLIDSEMTLNAI
ncbi:unknown [Prevotella sp. CAG:924]|nr:unknown [Prevotella sp. CAG:924]